MKLLNPPDKKIAKIRRERVLLALSTISPWYNSSDHGSLDLRTTKVQELNLGLILFAGFFVEV